MTKTVHIAVPKDDWIELSVLVGLNAHISNSGNATLVYVHAQIKPAVEDTKGHRLIDDNSFDYVISEPDQVWIRALNSDGLISVTPDIAVGATGGELSVVSGRGGITTDVLGVQKIMHDLSIFHGLFTFDVPPTMWGIEEDGVEVKNALSTRATAISGRLNVVSGPAAGNKTFVESRRHPQYQPSRGLKWAGSVGFKDANLDGILRAGFIVDEENGVFLKTTGDGKLYACIINDTVETHAELITFPFAIDITLGNIYDIQIQWRGVGNARFYAGNPSTGLLELVHEIIFLNTLDQSVYIRNPAMSASFHAINVTQEVTMWSGCVDVSVEGGRQPREQYGETSVTATVGSGDPILAVRNPTLAPNGKRNTRDLRLVRLTVTASKKATFKVYQTRDATAVTGGAWGAVKTGSFVEGNTTMTAVDIAKMEEFTTIRAAANAYIEKANPFAETIDFFGIHGDYIVVVCDTGSAVLTDFSIEWGEQI